ncbi:predicted protein [Postia placenta Mad-698-R]|nr:predicted protein [Postia placenta Mad-698-R]
MAHEMRAALQIAAQMHAQYEESRVRLWHPHLSLAWLGVPPGPFIADDGAAALQLHAVAAGAALWADTDTPGGAASAFDLTAAETREGLVEQGFAASSPRLPGGLSREILRQRERRGARRSVAELVMAAWSHPRVLRARIYAARVHRAVLHSPHLRHGMKNAIGVAVLSFPAFLPLDSTGRHNIIGNIWLCRCGCPIHIYDYENLISAFGGTCVLFLSDASRTLGLLSQLYMTLSQ